MMDSLHFLLDALPDLAACSKTSALTGQDSRGGSWPGLPAMRVRGFYHPYLLYKVKGGDLCKLYTISGGGMESEP